MKESSVNQDVCEVEDKKQRLLESACALFADKGFAKTTVAEICKAADANVASVNYYFGSKENLYGMVWRHTFECLRAELPEAEFADDESLDPLKRLHAFVATRIKSIFAKSTGRFFPVIMAREMTQPTFAKKEIFEEIVTPQVEKLQRLVMKIADYAITEEQAHRCVFSIISQCVFLNFHSNVKNKDSSCACKSSFSLDDNGVEELCGHVYRFSLAGIRSLMPEKSEGF